MKHKNKNYIENAGKRAFRIRRICFLQKTRERFINSINPIFPENEELSDLYHELELFFDDVICEEAKHLIK